MSGERDSSLQHACGTQSECARRPSPWRHRRHAANGDARLPLDTDSTVINLAAQLPTSFFIIPLFRTAIFQREWQRHEAGNRAAAPASPSLHAKDSGLLCTASSFTRSGWELIKAEKWFFFFSFFPFFFAAQLPQRININKHYLIPYNTTLEGSI